MASCARNTSLSVEYRLWQILVQAGWTLFVEGEALVPVDPQATTFQHPDIKQPWVFLDTSGKKATRNRVDVYVDGTLANRDDYTIDFLAGTVAFNTAPQGAVTVDFNYFVANVVENYPEGDDPVVAQTLEKWHLPAIAYGLTGFRGNAFAIGSTALDRVYPLTIDVLCSDDGQKKDLADDLVRYLQVIPLIDFSAHWALTASNEADSIFNPTTQALGFLRVGDLNVAWPNPRKGGSDKEKHRVLITATLKNVV